jgi:hypothetical protein
MLPTLAKLIFPIPAPAIWAAFGLAVVFATQPLWGLFLWGFQAVCGAF